MRLWFQTSCVSRAVRAGAALMLICVARAPAAAEPPLEAFAELPAITRPALSPDGRHLAMLQGAEGRRLPVVVTFDDEGKPIRRVRLDPGREMVDIVDIDWSGSKRLLISGLGNRPFQELPDNRILVYSVDRQELSPLVRPPRAGGHSLRARRQSRVRRSSVRLVDPLRFIPDQAIAVVTGPEADGAQVWRINLDSHSQTTLVGDADRYLSFQAGPEGELRLATRAPQGRTQLLYRADTGASWRMLTPPVDPAAGDRVAGISEDGSAILVLRPASGAGRILTRFDPETGRYSKPLFGPTGRDVVTLLTEDSPGRHRLVGYRASGHFRRDVYLDPAWAERQQRIDVALPESVNRIVESNTAATRHIVVAEAADRPRRYLIFDESANRMRDLGSSYPALEGIALPATRPVRYPAGDGTPIPAYLTLPQEGEPPFPAVVLVHGGPKSRVYQSFYYWVQFLASRGYAVLQPNFRGSDGYGAAWAAAGRREWGGLMQRDVDDGARWLAETRIAEFDRTCIMGGSYGGYAALMGVASSPDLYACAIAVNAVSDLKRMVRDDRRTYPGAPWTRFVGLGPDDEERLTRGSPLVQADRIAAPVLLVHARDDLRVPVIHSEAMADALESAGTTVRLVRPSSGGHPLTSATARKMLLEAVETFLHQSLEQDERHALR